MYKINENYQKLPGSYLFSTIAKKVSAFTSAHPDRSIIRLGIGDVTQPLTPPVIRALHEAVDEMGTPEGFHGYAPDLGYAFLRDVIAKEDFKARGCSIEADEIFVSDGAKCDSGNIQELFDRDNIIAVCDPVYPVYVDSNVMAGRTGTYDPETGYWSDVVYMPCTESNGFVAELPAKRPDIIYLCFPNNPTGAAITKDRLQEWVDSEPRLSFVRPEAGTTALVYYDYDVDSYDFCADMVKTTGALVTPGDAFEEPHSMRIGYAYSDNPDDLRQGLAAISAFMRTLE